MHNDFIAVNKKEEKKYISYIIMIGKNQKLRQRWVIKYHIKHLYTSIHESFPFFSHGQKVNAVES